MGQEALGHGRQSHGRVWELGMVHARMTCVHQPVQIRAPGLWSPLTAVPLCTASKLVTTAHRCLACPPSLTTTSAHPILSPLHPAEPG